MSHILLKPVEKIVVMSNGIGELAESSLHHALKLHYQNESDEIEQTLEGYVIDVIKPDELVEIQTSSFSSVKKKYRKLLKNHRIRMVYPIAEKKWLVKQFRSGRQNRRKSPKKGNIHELFRELVRIPDLINHRNFRLEVVFIHEEEYRREDGQGSWRRGGWSILDHKLLKITRKMKFEKKSDFLQILPEALPDEFTTKDLSEQLKIAKYMTQKMAYTFRKMGLISQIGKRGRYHLYKITTDP